MEALNIALPFSEENFTSNELHNSFYDYIYPWQSCCDWFHSTNSSEQEGRNSPYQAVEYTSAACDRTPKLLSSRKPQLVLVRTLLPRACTESNIDDTNDQ